jgi:hypothetical protein
MKPSKFSGLSPKFSDQIWLLDRHPSGAGLCVV